LPERHHLVGRDAELHEAAALLLADTTRLLTLTGPGGTGKTSLSLALGERVLPEFQDGVWFVDLSALPPGEANLVWPAVARVLRIAPVASTPPLDVLRDRLADQRLLLILDNCEHVLDAALPLARLLESCPGIRVLATSREPLHLRSERIFPVPPLGLPTLSPTSTPENLVESPAVALFVERARAVEPRFNLDADTAAPIAELCVRLGGLPLAIELAAARTRVLGPRALLDRAGRNPRLLASDLRDIAARHRTLAATIAWSYDLLDPGAQRLFRHLGLFSGSFSAEAVVAVIGSPSLAADSRTDGDMLDQLGVLADKSLLRIEREVHGQPRFRLLDTLRDFALEQLLLAGEADAAAKRHAAYYVDLAQQAGQEIPGRTEVAWLDRLDADYPNIRGAVRWMCANDEVENALRLGVAVSLFWRLRGHAHETLRWLEFVLPLTQHVEPLLRARALELAGRLGWASGQREQGHAWLCESIALRRVHGDTAGLVHALIELGMQEADRGESDAARAALEESLELARAIGDALGTVQALHGLGFRAEERGDVDLAVRLLEEAVTLRRSLGHASGLARTLNGLGIAARAQGDFARAQVLHLESLALYKELGHSLGAAYSLAYLAHVVAHSGDAPRSAALARESLELAWQQRNPWVLAEAIDVLGQLAASFGLADEAARLLAATEQLLGGALPRSSVARREHESALQQVREALGPSFVAVFDAGRALPIAEVVRSATELSHTIEQTVGGGEPAAAPAVSGGTVASGPLSERELEVAKLVARGLTNREIGEQLVISKWTADNHVANILRKLNLARRAQVAAWLAEQEVAASH
jgi:non-specific serine/threonine protein kinase